MTNSIMCVSVLFLQGVGTMQCVAEEVTSG